MNEAQAMLPLLRVDEVSVIYAGGKAGRDCLTAVDDVSFHVYPGEWVGLVGESGCGKSSLAQALTGLVPLRNGRVLWKESDVTALTGHRSMRRRMQMIFQDVSGALNPRLTVNEVLREVLAVHGLPAEGITPAERTAELLDAVGLPLDAADRYPHEFSGGQRQRLCIARALAVEPELLIADEPVSALDVSVQIQILDVLRKLRKEMGLAGLLIAHDLAVVRSLCQRMLVMYLGRVMEWGPVELLLERPSHPYTKALLAAVPDVERGLLRRKNGEKRELLTGEVPSRLKAVIGCPFSERCPRARECCRRDVPPEVVSDNGRHGCVCFFS